MATHRADRHSRHHAAPGESPAPGRRSAPRHARGLIGRSRTRGRRDALPSRLRSLPSLVGVAALALAATGAVAVDAQPVAHRSAQMAAQISAGDRLPSGTDSVATTDGPRELAISRDSDRQALQDAAGDKLTAASEQNAAERNAALKSLGRAAEAHAGQIAKNHWHLPTQGYRLTARFGMAGGLWSSNHTGLDFAAPTGTPIFAVANGVITGTGLAGAYGNRTVETLADGTELWYAHQSEIGVKPGEAVIAGQVIGKVGSTGNTTGPHVHLEVRPGGGDPVDPYQALVFHGVTP